MLLIGSASAARTHGRKDPEQLYAYKAEADNIHDTLLPILKAQLAEIMSVPTPLVTSKHKVTHYAHAQHGPGFKIRQITGSIVQGALLCGMGPTGKGCSHCPQTIYSEFSLQLDHGPCSPVDTFVCIFTCV